MALLRVSEELGEIAPVLSKEFAHYFYETQTGIPREQALTNLKERNGEQGLKSVTDVFIQSVKFGTDIAKPLRVHSDALRTERRQLAEEKGAKISAKLTLPLMLLVLPALLIVVVGPAVINIIEHLSEAF